MSKNRRVSRPNNSNFLNKNAAKGLSDERRAEINRATTEDDNAYVMGSGHHYAAVASNTRDRYPSFNKFASRQGVIPGSTATVGRMAPDIYSPLFQLANLNLPRDRVTMNAWNRVFYDTHPIVRNAVNLHASYPISKINITCKSKKVQQFFMDMAERLDLYSVVYGVALEFWKLGEAIPYAELDRETGTWKRITTLNPDYIHIKKAAIGDQTLISLRPDAGLQRLVNSTSRGDLQLRNKIPSHILDYVKKGQNIPMDPVNVSHLKLLSSPYDVRGTSVIVSVYKDLMLYDKLRESKFAQADGMINPITLVKLGGSNDYRPTPADIESFKNTLEEAQYDKDFKIVTHEGVEIQRVGFTGSVLDISPDIELIINNIYTGLMVPRSLMDQEQASYASSSVGLEVLRQRYDIFRNMLKKWLELKIFAPICELQGFYEYDGKEKKLVVPTVDFNHMNLYDMMDYVGQISQFVSTQQVSLQTLYRSIGLSYEEEQKKLREEAIDVAILQKEREYLSGMSLNEMLALNREDPIPEPKTPVAAQPGAESGMEGLPGVGGLGGGPDLGGGMGGPDLGGGMGGPDLGGGMGGPDLGGGMGGPGDVGI